MKVKILIFVAILINLYFLQSFTTDALEEKTQPETAALSFVNNSLDILNDKMKNCIAACSDCAIECGSCTKSCLEEPDVKMLTRCIQLNNDCSAICLLAMQSMSSGSEFAKQTCALCADICNACASECEKHINNKHCKKCANACRKCAEECIRMSKA